MIFSLDFEKEFDSQECDYLFRVLEEMNFDQSFCHWVNTFYHNCHNISSCIVNNGHASEFILLKSGVRQGFPPSGMLFILAVEPLAIQITTSI